MTNITAASEMNHPKQRGHSWTAHHWSTGPGRRKTKPIKRQTCVTCQRHKVEMVGIPRKSRPDSGFNVTTRSLTVCRVVKNLPQHNQYLVATTMRPLVPETWDG